MAEIIGKVIAKFVFFFLPRDLSNNQIESIDENAFVGLDQLKDL